VSTLTLASGAGTVTDLTLSDTLALVATRRSGLLLFDISDPSQPTFLAGYEPGDWARGVAVSDGFAFLSVSGRSESSQVHVLDIREPSKPVLVTAIETAGPAQRVFVERNRLYVADTCHGLLVLDISSSGEPQFAGRFRPNGMVGHCRFNATSVTASGGLVALKAGRGILVLEDES
jgi:hypothetical protein